MKNLTLKIVIVLSLCALAVVAAVAIFPDLASRYAEYNWWMLRRMWHSVFPFFWINLGVAAIIFIVEAVVVGWSKSSLHQLLRPDKSIVNDVFSFLINILQIDYIIVFFLTLGIVHKLKLGIKTAVDLDQGILASFVESPVLQVLIYVVIADLMLYIEHRIHHAVPFLWNFHSYHHSATELNVLTSHRSHPVQEELSNGLITVIPMTLLGIPLVSILIFRMLRNAITFMQHSRLTWNWGWFGRYVIVSPAYHRVHHSVLPEHYDYNLAVLFPAWDHLFGTYYAGKVPARETGLPDNPYNQKNYLHDITVPFRMLRQRRTRATPQNGVSAHAERAGSDPHRKAILPEFETLHEPPEALQPKEGLS